MKHLLLTVSLTLSAIIIHAQNSIGIGTTSPHASAILDIQSSNKGLLAPRMTTAQRTAIASPATGLLVYDTDTWSYWHYAGTAWRNMNVARMIADTDGDTRVLVEAFPDDDIIRFELAGTEYFRMESGRLKILNTGNSVIIGDGAGIFEDLGGNNNIFIGTSAGWANNGSSNTVIGNDALSGNWTGGSNTAVGRSALGFGTTGSGNTAVGWQALVSNAGTHNTGIGAASLQLNSSGNYNTVVGHSALVNNLSGHWNTAVGWAAGNNNSSGSANVFLGYLAGANETGSDKLYIANSGAGPTGALIYGDFQDQLLRINGTLQIGTSYAFPEHDGSAGQVLQTNGSGIVTWQSAGGDSDEIRDADGDTRVMVEKFFNENRIRFDLGGTEHFVMDGPRLEVKNSGNSVFIGEGAGANDDLTDNSNVFVGKQAGMLNTEGNFNIALGVDALRDNVDGFANLAIGVGALVFSTGSDNLSIGNSALMSNRANSRSLAIGKDAMAFADNRTNGRATLNTAIGYQAMRGSGNPANNTGRWNTAVGDQAMLANSSGDRNTASGFRALLWNNSGHDNVAFGNEALYSNEAGSGATAIGAYAMQYAYDGTSTFESRNVAVGYEALRGSDTPSTNTGNNNTAIGYTALRANTSGSENTGTGYVALIKNTTGQNNTAYGSNTLHENIVGSGNTAVGREALYYARHSGNTAIGTGSGVDSDNSENCTYIGHDADNDTWINSYSNSTAMGNASRMTASNQVRIGNASVTSIGGFANWSNISDARYKTHVQENVPGLAFIQKLRPVTYQLNVNGLADHLNEDVKNSRAAQVIATDADRNARLEKQAIVQSGFLAQDVEAAARELGFQFSGIDAPGNATDLYGLRYAEFVVPLVKAVQELSDLVGDQQQLISHLQSTVSELEQIVIRLQNER